jgi:hypothetical protein
MDDCETGEGAVNADPANIEAPDDEDTNTCETVDAIVG